VNSRREQGIALLIVMMMITLLAALAASLTLATVTETAVAGNYRDATQALYAADAGLEFVLQEIAQVDDWRDLLSAPGQSVFVDGPPAGLRQVGDAAIDLTAATLEVASMATPSAGAVHGPSVLWAFGWFQDLSPVPASRPRTYVAVWLADRSLAPRDEGAEPGTLSVVARAFGEGGAHRAVEAVVEKAGTSAVRTLGWRELH
jgi:hypothetical protein